MRRADSKESLLLRRCRLSLWMCEERGPIRANCCHLSRLLQPHNSPKLGYSSLRRIRSICLLLLWKFRIALSEESRKRSRSRRCFLLTLDTFNQSSVRRYDVGMKVLQRTPSPSQLAPILVCFAFTPKPFPNESRRFFEIGHRIALLTGIKELVENHGCQLPPRGSEKSVGNGVMDAELIDADGNPTILEATGSNWVKITKIIQACLYSADRRCRVWVCSINETLECPPWLIGAINARVWELLAFRNKYPDIASRLYTPHQDVCRLCNTIHCPYWKPARGENIEIRKEV